MRRAEGTYDPASSSNDAAARGGAGAAMARLTGEAKAAGEEGRGRATCWRRSETRFWTPRRAKDAGRRRRAAADEMDDADRALIDADARFQDTHALAVRLGDQHAAARLLGDAPEAAAATRSKLDAPPRAPARRAPASTRRRTRSSAPCLSRNRAWTTPRVSPTRTRASLECENAEARCESAVALATRRARGPRRGGRRLRAVRAAAASSQADFAGPLGACAARAGVSLARSAAERAVHAASDRAAHLDAAVDEQDLASAEKAMAERVAELPPPRSTSFAARRPASLRRARSRRRATPRRPRRRRRRRRAARAAAAAADRDTKRVEASGTLAAKVAEVEAAAAEGFSGPKKERGLLFATEAARLARELDSAEAEAARERAAEAERVCAACDGGGQAQPRGGGRFEALPKDASPSPRSSRGPRTTRAAAPRCF